MAYATQADIITIYSADALHVADRDGDGVIDADAVTRALDSSGILQRAIRLVGTM